MHDGRNEWLACTVPLAVVRPPDQICRNTALVLAVAIAGSALDDLLLGLAVQELRLGVSDSAVPASVVGDELVLKFVELSSEPASSRVQHIGHPARSLFDEYCSVLGLE